MHRTPDASPLLVVLAALAALSLGGAAPGPEPPTPGAKVRLNFPQGVPLKTLVDYVSERTGTRFIYDEGLQGSVIIRSPVDVDAAELVPVLRSILDFRGFQMVEADGWHRIRRGDRAEMVRREEPADIILADAVPGDLAPDRVYTVLLRVRHSGAEDFAQTLNRAAGLSPVPVPRSRTLVLTEYGSRIALALRLADALDRPGEPMALGVYVCRHVQAAQIKDAALGILRARLAPDLTVGGPQAEGPALYVDAPTNRLILLLPEDVLSEAEELLAVLDVEAPVELRSYSTGAVGADRASAFIGQAVRARLPGLPELTMHTAGDDALLVIATPRVHEVVADALDSLVAGSDLSLRYYVVQHVQATRVEALARAILGVGAGAREGGEMLMVAPQENTLVARLSSAGHDRLQAVIDRFDTPQEAVRATRLQFYRIRNTDASELAQRLRMVLGLAAGADEGEVESGLERLLAADRYTGIRRVDLPGESAPEPAGADALATRQPEAERPPAGIDPEAVRVVADRNTNTIIVQAPIEYHETIQRLIEYLDRRRPQVLIEATIATVSSDSTMTVAVELLRASDARGMEALIFSAFGLSEVDLDAGTRTLKPATGFNAGIVDPDSSSAIIRALRTDNKSRVLAEPRILVNDKAVGRFESVHEEPFTSVNVGDTVSTTTFAGYAEAGLTIEVAPQISEGDFVRLDYAITSRDFGESSGEGGIPPPRTSDAIASSVTVPDGHTVIMGGLLRERGSYSESKVPVLGSIPILGALFSSREKGGGETRLFIFLRPVILRDDDFTDLKLLSRAGISRSPAEPPGPDSIYPPVTPRVMR
jgi:type II secretory pathway component GspD/PulD (secretin)